MALGTAAIGSFVAGLIATLGLAFIAPYIVRFSLSFGPAEYFSLMVLGLIFAVVLAKGSVLKALTMILCGLMLSMIGSDLETGAERMTWGIPELSDGIGFVVIASLIGPINFDGATVGEKTWQPKDSSDLLASYSTLLGAGKLDLTALNLTEDTTVKVDAKLGSVEIVLPRDLDVRKNSTILAGETTGLPDGFDNGADGTEGPVLTLDITSRLGSVDVHRGN